MDVINLRGRFGDGYRIQMEESYHADKSRHRIPNDPHLQIIPGALGHIFAWDDRHLAVATKSAGSVAKRLKALPWVEVVQDGSDGINAVFPVEHFQEVADMIRARRRRRLSPEARRAAGERLRPFRFPPAVGANPEGRPCASVGSPV